MNEISESLCRLVRILDALGVKYLVGGSVASGVWGEPRQTNDVDIELWLPAECIEPLLKGLEQSYAFAKAEVEAVSSQPQPFEAFQIIDSVSVLKFDCFVQGASPIDGETYERGREVPFGPCTVRVACPEHILIQKLRWYELGRRVSERQWRDITSIVQSQRNLDQALVLHWASLSGVSDLAKELFSPQK